MLVTVRHLAGVAQEMAGMQAGGGFLDISEFDPLIGRERHEPC